MEIKERNKGVVRIVAFSGTGPSEVWSVHKKLSCRRETARRFVSLNISLSHSSHSRSFEMTSLNRACVTPY